MLTSFQASPIAYWADEVPDVKQGSGPYCSDCADELSGGQVESGEHDEMFVHYYNTPQGFQPASRYGVEEAYPDGVDCERCGAIIVEAEDDEDPNPPVPRWVPCSTCGALDGQPHETGCIQIAG